MRVDVYSQINKMLGQILNLLSTPSLPPLYPLSSPSLFPHSFQTIRIGLGSCRRLNCRTSIHSIYRHSIDSFHAEVIVPLRWYSQTNTFHLSGAIFLDDFWTVASQRVPHKLSAENTTTSVQWATVVFGSSTWFWPSFKWGEYSL